MREREREPTFSELPHSMALLYLKLFQMVLARVSLAIEGESSEKVDSPEFLSVWIHRSEEEEQEQGESQVAIYIVFFLNKKIYFNISLGKCIETSAMPHL